MPEEQVGQGWTQYHDFLMQQAVMIMSNPDWADPNGPYLAQLAPIQEELKLAGGTLGSGDAQQKELFDQFQEAYKAGTAQKKIDLVTLPWRWPYRLTTEKIK